MITKISMGIATLIGQVLAVWGRGVLMASLLVFGGIPARTVAQDLTKVRCGVITTASTAALIVGAEKGIFKKYGFDVEVIPIATGVQASQALASNQVDWSGGGIESTIVAWGTRLPFTAYAMYAKGGDAFGLLVRKDADINRFEDLKGKRVAVTNGTALAQALSQVLLSVGLPGNAVQRVNANLSNMGPMLLQGSVDAMVGIEPFLTLAQEQIGDDGKILARMGEYVQGGGFFSIADKWAQAHPDKIQSAVEAMWEAEHYIRHHLDESADIVAKFIKAEPRLVKIAFSYYDFNPIIDDFTLQSAERTVKYLASEGVVSDSIKVESYLDPALRIGRALKTSRPELLQ